MLLLGIEKNDSEEKANQLIQKILNYRIFNDENGKMNLSLQDIGGDLLVVSQFTLAADTKKGCAKAFLQPRLQPKRKCFMNIFLTKQSTAIMELLLVVNLAQICRYLCAMMDLSHSY